MNRRAILLALLSLTACRKHYLATHAPHAHASVAYEERVLTPVHGTPLPLTVSLAIADLHDGVWIGDALFAASSIGVVVFPDALDAERAPIVIGPRNGLPSANVASLTRIGDELWAATERGVSRIAPATRTVLGGALLGERVHVVLDAQTALTPRGLVRIADGALLEARTDARVAVRCGARYIVGDHIDGLPDVPISSLRCRNDAVLVGTPLGLYILEHERIRRLRTGHVTAIAVDGARVLVGTLAQGVFELGRPARKAGRAWLVAADGERVATFVDRTLVVSRHGRSAQRTLGGPRGLITALVHDGDTTWVGTFDDGLYRLDAHGYTTVPLADPRVTALAKVHDELWIGTAAGLHTLAGPIKDVSGWLRHFISAIAIDGDVVRVAAFPGLVELDPSQRVLAYRSGKDDEPGTTPPLFGTAVTGATRVGNDVWLSTLEGLQRIDASHTEVWSAVGGALPDDWVNDVLAVDRDLYFLLGDRGFGRVRNDRVTVWRAPLSSSPGSLRRIGDGVAFVASDALFFAHGDRVTRFDTPFAVNAIDYDAATDRLWLGGTGGIARLDHATSVFVPPLSFVSEALP